MQIQFLGTGAGMPSKGRNVSSLALKLLEERGTIWLFDCGEATQHLVLHTTIKPRKIDKIFITHLHGDHIFGLPGFLGSRSFLGGDGPLTIYGPKGIEEWILLTFKITGTHLGYPIRFVEVNEGIIFEDEQFIVTAMLLEHVVPSYGYRIEQKQQKGTLLMDKAVALGVPKGPLLGRLKNGEDIVLEDGTVVRSIDVTEEPKKGFTVTILGDTMYSENSIRLSEEADVLIHESTFDASLEEGAAAYGHSTNLIAAKVAQKARVKNLLLNHISARYLSEDASKMVYEVRKIIPNAYIVRDLDEFTWLHGELKQSLKK
ncbi:ribonuclease Z [Rummeliibacillus sp. BSL5]